MSRGIIIGRRYYPTLATSLEKLGYKTLCLPENPLVDKRLASHADLSLFAVGPGSVVAAPYLRDTAFAAQLASHGVKTVFSDIDQGHEYPFDAALNAILIGRLLIFSNGITADEVVAAAYDAMGKDLRLISVRQGYIRCSLCAIGENAAITADRGIARALENEGFDVMLISPQGVRLDGFEYGFIGGASVTLEDDLLAFTGHLADHPDAERIERFIASHGVRTVYLTDEPIFDIGGAVLI